MSIVFLSGSRNISKLNKAIKDRIDNIINNNYKIFIGDANGADKAIQKYLAEKKYKNVSIYFSGKICRNNIGYWPNISIEVEKDIKGYDFYTKKDKEMAKKSNFGFILWDGKSRGALNNAIELASENKKTILYFSPKKEFISIKSIEDIHNLLGLCSNSSFEKLMEYNDIRRKLGFLKKSNFYQANLI